MLQAPLGIGPVARQIQTGVPKSVRPLDPYLFAFQRTLEVLEDTELIVMAHDFRLSVHFLTDLLLPGRRDHPFQRDVLCEVALMSAQVAPNHRQGFDERLKAILTAKV